MVTIGSVELCYYVKIAIYLMTDTCYVFALYSNHLVSWAPVTEWMLRVDLGVI